jgi:hypothetical protein
MLIELMIAATDISLVPANLSVVCISNHGIFPYFEFFWGFYIGIQMFLVSRVQHPYTKEYKESWN